MSGVGGTKTKRIIWSPHLGYRFLVGANDLRLYEWEPGIEGDDAVQLLAVNPDTTHMKVDKCKGFLNSTVPRVTKYFAVLRLVASSRVHRLDGGGVCERESDNNRPPEFRLSRNSHKSTKHIAKWIEFFPSIYSTGFSSTKNTWRVYATPHSRL